MFPAGCWNCDEFYVGKTKRRIHDRKTEHFKALAKSDHSPAIADHVKTTGCNMKWDHFDILESGKTDFHCKIKETLFIQELKPSLNVNVSSEKLLLYQLLLLVMSTQVNILLQIIFLSLGSRPLMFLIYKL